MYECDLNYKCNDINIFEGHENFRENRLKFGEEDVDGCGI